jgi:hypothetical protein
LHNYFGAFANPVSTSATFVLVLAGDFFQRKKAMAFGAEVNERRL